LSLCERGGGKPAIAKNTWKASKSIKSALSSYLESARKKRLERIARHYCYLSATALIEQWAAQVASEVAEKEEQKAKKEITTRYKHNA
jgi:GH25 family lysozyme M1 (1,4-beta-N-acetylmuramidase)